MRRSSAVPLAILATAVLFLSACSFEGGTADRDDSTVPSDVRDDSGNPTGTTFAVYPPTEAGVHQENGMVYRTVDGQDLTLNACTPENATGALPAVLIIHGGGFSHGSNHSKSMRNLCVAVAQAGMVGFSVEYRLAPAHPFPAAIDDVQDAVQWLREPEQVNKFGIDPKRIGTIGSSAGATLAMELGTLGEGDLHSGARVAAVVSLSGASDVTPAGRALGDLGEGPLDLLSGYLGCTDLDACPQATDASPLYQVDPTDAPMFIVHSLDEFIPVAQAEVMIQAFHDADVQVESRLVPGRKHATNNLDTALWTDIVAFLHAIL